MPPKHKSEKKVKPTSSQQFSSGALKEKHSTTKKRAFALRKVQLQFPHDRYALLAGFIVALLLFSNGFTKELVFDDILAIDRNADAATGKGTSVFDIFHHDFWGHGLGAVASNGSYRPLIIITFRLQYLLAGRAHKAEFLHLLNYIVAYLNACMVYYLARLYHQMVQPRAADSLEDDETDDTSEKRRHSRLQWVTSEPYGVPTMAMLLYLVHPAHVDAVTSIVGRCELLYCLFGLLSFFAVHAFATRCTWHDSRGPRARYGQERLKGAGGPVTRVRTALEDNQSALLALVAVLLICCLLCKDSGITFTAIFVLHASLLYAWGFTSKRRLAVIVALSIGMTVAYFAFRHSFIGGIDLSKSKLLRRTENPQYFIPGGAWHWLSMRWTIQVKNFELLFYPTALCCEYSYNCIPHMESIQDSRFPYYVAVSSILLVCLLSLLYCALARGSRLAVMLLLFVMWIAIPYAPISHLFVHVGTFIAERCLYVPSIGVALIYAFLLQPSLEPLPSMRVNGNYRGTVKVLALLVLVAVWFSTSHQRNTAWKSNISLFREAIKVCPSSGKSHAQLAIAMSSRDGKLTNETVALFQKSLTLDREDKAPLFYLAVDQWQSKRNAKVAYEMIRECVSSPFTLSMCFPMYAEMREALFPNMTTVEKILDEGLVLPLDSQRASRFRDASFLQRAESHSDPCAGLSAMSTAMHLWNRSALYWASDEVEPTYKEKNFCNSAYWWAEIFDQCHLQPNVPEAERQVTTIDGNGEVKSVVAPRTLRQGMRDMRMAAKNCMTDWHAPGVVRGAAKTTIQTYANRLRDFPTLMTRLRVTLAHTKPFLLGDAEKRMAKLTGLEVAVSQYCGVVTLVENHDVKASLGEFFLGEVAQYDAAVAESQGRWRIEIVSLWKDAQLMRSDSEQENEQIQLILSEIQQMAQCSLSLSAVLV